MIRHIYNSVMCLDLSEASHYEKPSGFSISVYLFTDNTKFLKCDQLSQEMNTVNVGSTCDDTMCVHGYPMHLDTL